MQFNIFIVISLIFSYSIEFKYFEIKKDGENVRFCQKKKKNYQLRKCYIYCKKIFYLYVTAY